MTLARHALLLGYPLLLATALQPLASQAGLHHYSFIGEVTSVDNSGGYLAALATVGATVSGAFRYADAPGDGFEEFSPFVTFYLHDRSVDPVTELVLAVGGAEARSSATSLTNVAIGNDNSDPMPPFFPEGDFYRYLDELDAGASLFDFGLADLQQFPVGNIVLADSTGAAFTSHNLPHGLPLTAFDQRQGSVLIFDENSDLTGRLEFRIDSIQAIPEPSSVVLALFAIAAIQWRTPRTSFESFFR